jgi:hypothetical protein
VALPRHPRYHAGRGLLPEVKTHARWYVGVGVGVRRVALGASRPGFAGGRDEHGIHVVAIGVIVGAFVFLARDYVRRERGGH